MQAQRGRSLQRNIRFLCLIALAAILAAAASHQTLASPWAEAGDTQLRSDLELLAARGLIDNITTHWPLPWASIVPRLRAVSLVDEPEFVQEAIARVLYIADGQTDIGHVQIGASSDITNAPANVRDFGALGLEDTQAQLTAEYLGYSTAVRLAAGFQIDHHSGRVEFVPDGSYVAQRLDFAVLYAGYLTHWWGPGWISALSLSNNARPFPQIGIERSETSASASPLLSWLGPWQAEFIVGWFDDRRVATNTLWDGFRFTFNPLPGLEIGLGRSDELCGKGHPCKPLATYFDLQNTNSHPSRTNDEGLIDLKYSGSISQTPYSLYTQVMNEDTNPFIHSKSSHLFGATVWIPGLNHLRLTVEYTNTIATLNIIPFRDYIYGETYNDYKYPGDGMRYDGRALGFSLDSDSRLFSVQAGYLDSWGRSYTLTIHRAEVSTPLTGTGNPLTSSPVTIDILDGRVRLPLHGATLDLGARVQDDQFRPKRGFAAALETALKIVTD